MTIKTRQSANWNSNNVFRTKRTTGLGRFRSSLIVPPSGPIVVIDPNVSLLLHMNGTNGSQIFFDSSYNRKIVTVHGNSQITTSVSKFGGASGYFDGSGDYLTVPYSSEFNLSSGDFTIEFWFNANTLGGTILSKDTYGLWGDWGVRIINSNTLQIGIYGDAIYTQVTVPTMSTGVWYHFAVVRSSGVNTFYFNGTSCGSNSNGVSDLSQAYVTIGCAGFNYPNNFFNGYIDELRISKTARYTGNFTPQTSEFPDASAVPPVINSYCLDDDNPATGLDVSGLSIGGYTSARGQLTASSPISPRRPNHYANFFVLVGAVGGASYQIDLISDVDATDPPTGNPIDTFMYLLSGPCSYSSTLAQDDDGGGSAQSRIYYTFGSSGNYLVECTTWSSYVTGYFQLKVTRTA